MATAAFATTRTTANTSSAVTPPTMATATSAAPANFAGRVVAPAQLLRLSTSQQQRQALQLSSTRSPLQPIELQLKQFQIQQRPADSCAHQIHHPPSTLPNDADSLSLSANRRPQRPQARQQGTAAAVALATSERLTVWRRSSASSSPPPSSSCSSSSSSSSTSVSITRASASAHQQHRIRLHRVESLENKLLASESQLFVANGGARVAAAQCESPVCVIDTNRRRSEVDALATVAAAATEAHHNQVSSNNLTHKKLVVGRPSTLTTLTTAATTRVANRHVYAKLSTTPTKLISTPATTNSRLRKGALYARRQYHITAVAAAASTVGPSLSTAALSATSLGRQASARCSNLRATSSSLTIAQLAPNARSCSRTLAPVSALGRVRPPSRLSARSASLTSASGSAAVAADRIAASISGGLTSQSSSSTSQLTHSQSGSCRQKQQQYNYSRLVTSRFLRSVAPTSAVARAQREQATAATRASQSTSSEFSLLSSSTTSFLSLGSIKHAKSTPRLAREKAATLEVETRIIHSHSHNHYHSGEQRQEQEMQLQSQQQNQKRPIGLSRRSSNSSSGSDGGSCNVKRLTSLNNSSLRSSLLVVNSSGVSGGGADLSSIRSPRRQSTPAGNRSTSISTASTSTAAAAAAAYLAATAQQRGSDICLAGVVCDTLSHADQRKSAAVPATITARSRSSSDNDSESRSNGDNNNSGDNDYGHKPLAAKSHKDLTGNLVSTKNTTANGNQLPFIDKSISFANQQQPQLNCQETCKSIIASNVTAAAVAAVAAKHKMKIQSGSIVSTGKDNLIPSPINTNKNFNININHNNNISIIATGRRGPPDLPIRTEPISDYYDLEARPFARGKFAQVKRCISKSTKQCFAAKCIKKRRRLVDIRHEILLEIEALKLSYRTDRIVKLFEVFETQTEITLILEMADGGELQRVLDEEEVIDERLVKRMIRQILEGLVELHDIDIAHLDIKPQNLLLTQSFPNGDVKLCDFGISRRITKDCEIREICGTPDYVAPEILSYDPISLATDMWSLGVLTYVLLSGYSPFGSEDKQQTFCNITQATLDFPSEIFEKISDEAIDFMKKLILREPSERLTSRQAKNHPWLNSGL